ncbi:hypothetical protein JMF97_17245 [Micromonospora fiedleri]|uniref:Lipoprotein n=1 Tax=Micromonospora fiedleri TaxID=1157498 RepID=A0ABS1UNH7_9ACTN|nr:MULTISPECIES: hypothetical protein [Micromonospora]MBL6277902.1 hypothetical protein [Micromonospora fiedleri]WSK41018.1 hypothetical protein OG712_21190 [Micromonospora maris]
MGRVRGLLVVLAAGLMLTGCAGGTDDGTASGGAETPAATSEADGGQVPDQGSGGTNTGSGDGDRWCDAVQAFSTSMDPLFTESAGKAELDQARTRLKELKAAAPAEIKSDVTTLGEFYAAVIDASGKSMPEDPAAWARVGQTTEGLKTAMPPVSDYTMKRCPEFDGQLPTGQ